MSVQRIYIKSEEFQPTEGLVLTKPIELKKEETTMSGLVISIKQESIVVRPSHGKVIAVGDNCKAEIGKVVFWPMSDGLDLEFDDGQFLLVRDKAIIGIKKD